MTLTLPTYVEAHRADSARRYHFLLYITATGSTSAIRLTDAPVDLSYGGNTYLSSRQFTVTGIGATYSGGEAIDISIWNGDGVAAAWGAAWRGSDAMPTITLTEVWFDATTTDAAIQASGAYVIASGVQEGISWTAAALSLRVVPPTTTASDTPGLGPRWTVDKCSYRTFKGLECGYAGATASCDRLYATCQGLGNSARYGGVRANPENFLLKAGSYNFWWNVPVTLVAWDTGEDS